MELRDRARARAEGEEEGQKFSLSTDSCWILRSKTSSKGWDTGIHLTPFIFSIPNRHKTLSLESDRYIYIYILLLGICYPKT